MERYRMKALLTEFPKLGDFAEWFFNDKKDVSKASHIRIRAVDETFLNSAFEIHLKRHQIFICLENNEGFGEGFFEVTRFRKTILEIIDDYKVDDFKISKTVFAFEIKYDIENFIITIWKMPKGVTLEDFRLSLETNALNIVRAESNF